MGVALVVVRLGLAAVFGVAAIAKLADGEGSRHAVAQFGVPAALVGSITFGLPVIELVIAFGLVLVMSAAWAAGAALVLLVVFCAAIIRLLARGEAPSCHCFGTVAAAPVGRGMLVRNLMLVALAGFVAVAGWNHAGMSVPELIADLGAVAIALGVAMVLHAAFSWQLFGQNGRLLERVSVLETALGLSAGEDSGRELAIGDRAPDFALPDLDGQTVSLRELLRPGRGVALVFTDPGCGHCNPLLPALGHVRGDHEPVLVVISRGARSENYAKAQEHGIAPLLLQQDFEVAQAYGNQGLPGAVLIDAAGRIASARVGGAEAVAELLHAAPEAPSSRLSVRHFGGRISAEASST